MTQDMMTLRALLEKSSDADLLREMIGFKAMDGRGFADRRCEAVGTGVAVPRYSRSDRRESDAVKRWAPVLQCRSVARAKGLRSIRSS